MTRMDRVLLIDSYQRIKKILSANEKGYCSIDKSVCEAMQMSIKKFDDFIEGLEEKERFIVENEVLLGKSGNWWTSYYSESAYRANRKSAYEKFLKFSKM